jgi:hypothetical protein
MTVVNEFDAVRIRQQVEADVIDTNAYNTTVIIPAGSHGVVVHVHGPRTNPVAYEVQFFVEALDCDAIATVDADIVLAR